MARPQKLTKEHIDNICKVIEEETVSLDTAAIAGGISPATFYRYQQDAKYLQQDPESAIASFTVRFANSVNTKLGQTLEQLVVEYVELLEYFFEQVTQARAKAEIRLVQEVRREKGGARFILARRYGYDATTINVRRGEIQSGVQNVDVRKLPTRDLEQLIEGEILDESE
jgi:hypothetical protein